MTVSDQEVLSFLYDLSMILPGIGLVYYQYNNGLEVRISLLVLFIWAIIGILIPKPNFIRSRIQP